MKKDGVLNDFAQWNITAGSYVTVDKIVGSLLEEATPVNPKKLDTGPFIGKLAEVTDTSVILNISGIGLVSYPIESVIRWNGIQPYNFDSELNGLSTKAGMVDADKVNKSKSILNSVRDITNVLNLQEGQRVGSMDFEVDSAIIKDVAEILNSLEGITANIRGYGKVNLNVMWNI